MRLAGYVALVTGGSRGIGRAIALRLAEEGADVAINYAQNQEAAEDVVRRVEAVGRRSIAVRADVRDEKQVLNMVNSVKAKFGKVDLLVNSAGIMHPVKDHQPFWETPTKRWDDVMAVDLRGPFLCAKAVALDLLARKAHGSILSLTSIAGAAVGLPIVGVEYNAAKAGIVGLTLDLAAELGPHGITANALAPGAVPTEMSSHLLDPEIGERRANQIPLRRLGTPEEIGAIAAFLLSEDASFITGQVIVADGGFTRMFA